MGLIGLDLLRIGIAEAVGLTFLPETREVRPPGEEVDAGPLQIPERLLQGIDRRIGQPGRFRVVALPGEQLTQSRIAGLLPALLMAFLLQRQRLVKDEPARASEAAHLPLLLAVRHQCEPEGLTSLHTSLIRLACEQ